MSVCMFIMASRNPNIVSRMVGRMQNDDINVFLHVDAKSEADFSDIANCSNLRLACDRLKVDWGGMRWFV